MDQPGENPTTPPGNAGGPPPTVRATGFESSGDNIGPYHLIEIIGAGGFGVVYLAERREPLVQRVALKVIKPGMDTRAVVARFEQERQALALLDHPNIAKVFDAGATTSGRPYFVMELVRGKTLTEYAAAHNLDLRQRLTLLATVARAVDHANQHGLVHRDLKPSNILVCEHDGKPIPKVIDFGVVKALTPTLSDKTIMTGPNQAIGTLGYMSPEQADPSVSEVDARSDVYSLGIVMFELLTGQLPYDLDKLHSVSPSELPKLLAILPPKRAGDIDPALKGDSDTIIRRAMHPDWSRRYQSAHELANELERFLRGEPIQAHRDSMLYVACTRLRAAARRAPLAVPLIAWLLAMVLSFYLVEPLMFQWTNLGGRYGPLLSKTAGLITAQPTMEHTRVLALSDDHTPEEMGTLADVHGVTSANPLSMRLVDGELLRRLAAAGPAVVVIDISFSSDAPEFDKGLRVGIDALNAAKIPWVAALSKYPLGEHGPEVISAIRGDPAAFYACGSFAFGDGFPFLSAVARRGPGRPSPSLAVVAYALARRPDANFDVALHDDTRVLDLSYWVKDPAAPGSRPASGEPDVIQLTSVQELGAPDSNLGTLAHDTVGLYHVAVPDDTVLDTHTQDVADALQADAQTMRILYSDKIVVFGDMRVAQLDLHMLPENRVVGGPQLVAAAIDELLLGRATVTPDAYDKLVIVGVLGLIGAVIGHLRRGRVGKWWIVIALISLALLVASLLGYALVGFLCNPTVPLVTMLTASVMALVGSRSLLGSSSQGRTVNE